MLTYTLDKDSEISLYERLYGYIKEDIISGRLKSGDKLPSKRTLAENLKVSIITVESAYAQLIAEGYIYSEEKKGYFVSGMEELPETVKPVKKKSFERVPQKYFIDFSTNNISSDVFPFTVWTRILRSVINDEGTKLLEPLRYNGVYEFREAVASYLYRFRGIAVSPGQIIIGAGTEYLYNLIIQLLGRDKIYAFEDPGHTKIARIYKVNDVACRHIPVTREGLSTEELKSSGADVVHVSPSHHFPTGAVMPITKRRELLKWASEGERYIIEDDYDTEFRFVGRPIQSLVSIGENSKVIYMNTFSKSLAPSIRISYMVLPENLLSRYEKELGFYSCAVSGFEQFTLAKFISSGYFEQHINRTKTLYRKKRDAVINAFLSAPFADKITIEEENAGLHFLVRIDTEMSDDALIEAAKSKGILITCMSKFLSRPNPSYEHIIVVNYSGIDVDKLPEAVSRLSEIIR